MDGTIAQAGFGGFKGFLGASRGSADYRVSTVVSNSLTIAELEVGISKTKNLTFSGEVKSY